MLINAYRSLSSISSPLFSIRYAGMDDGGMVGGYMYNEKIFINELLRNVSQILNGKPAREIPFFVPADAHPTFNYTTLVNKGLNPKLCPQNSIFYDKPENFLKKYIWVITGIFITLLLIPYPTKTHTNVERTKKGSKARIRKPNQIYKPYRQYAYSLYERESD